ncbi:MAG: hypothetical protein ACOYN0_09770, partial [Phycisphaerales bacterium]
AAQQLRWGSRRTLAFRGGLCLARVCGDGFADGALGRGIDRAAITHEFRNGHRLSGVSGQ